MDASQWLYRAGIDPNKVTVRPVVNTVINASNSIREAQTLIMVKSKF